MQTKTCKRFVHDRCIKTDHIIRPIPEHFIWQCLSQITEALLVFREGVCEDPTLLEAAESDSLENEDLVRKQPTIDKEPWEPLIHGDIKSQNIFCCDGNEKYPSYPRAVLADFDTAHYKKDAETWRWVGTRGWQSPVRIPGSIYSL